MKTVNDVLESLRELVNESNNMNSVVITLVTHHTNQKYNKEKFEELILKIRTINDVIKNNCDIIIEGINQ